MTLYIDGQPNSVLVSPVKALVGGVSYNVTFPAAAFTVAGVQLANTWSVDQVFATGKGLKTAQSDASTLLGIAQNAAGQTQTVWTIVGAATVANSYFTAQVGGTWTLASGQTWSIPALTFGGAVAGGAKAMTNLGSLLIGSATAYGRLGQVFEIHTSGVNGGLSVNSWSNVNNDTSLIDFQRSGSSTIGNYAAITSGYAIALLMFRGSDGTDFQESSYTKVLTTGTIGDNRVAGRKEEHYYTNAASSVDTTVEIADATGITWPIGVGFFTVTTPVGQQTGCAVPTDLATAITAITALRTALNNLGLTTVV